jgi:intracellular septation protein A
VRIKKKQIGKEMECRRADPIRVGPFFAYAVFGIDCFNKNLYMVLLVDLEHWANHHSFGMLAVIPMFSE